MAKPKGGLGRGLSTLIPENEYELNAAETSISIDKIIPSENQPRKVFDKDKIRELSESIALHGVLQPLIVVKENDIYRIVAGERRYRASVMAGLKEVPVIVRDLSESEILQIALIENLQREDISDIEAAAAYKELGDKFGYTQEQIAEKIGKSRAAVANTLRLMSLDEEIRNLISEKKLSAGHARAVLALKDENKRTEFAKYIVEKGLSVREAEKLSAVFDGADKERKSEPVKAPKNPHYIQLEDELRTVLGTKVTFKPKKNKGTIEIEYYSNDDLQRLIELFNSLGD